MARSNDFGVGLMHETAITASKAGWEPEDIARLAKDEALMKMICGVLHGTHEIKEIEHFIDCDAQPLIPEDWNVDKHLPGGIIKFEPSKIELYISKEQSSGSIEGYKLRDELKGKKLLNATVLDYLLENPKAIPEAWVEKAVFFWGTIYKNSKGHLSVRCLYWCDDKWRWGSDRLSTGWSVNSPAAVLINKAADNL